MTAEAQINLEGQDVLSLSEVPEGTTKIQHAANLLGAAVRTLREVGVSDFEVVTSTIGVLGFYANLQEQKRQIEIMREQARAEARAEAMKGNTE